MLPPSLGSRHYAAPFPHPAKYFFLAFPPQAHVEVVRTNDEQAAITDPSPTSPPSSPQDCLRDHAIAALVPFFIAGNAGDEVAARTVAEGLLDDYHPATPKELQLSTQIIALGWASLACVSASMAVKDQSLEEMLRLQSLAIALNRSSQKATKALEA